MVGLGLVRTWTPGELHALIKYWKRSVLVDNIWWWCLLMMPSVATTTLASGVLTRILVLNDPMPIIVGGFKTLLQDHHPFWLVSTWTWQLLNILNIALCMFDFTSIHNCFQGEVEGKGDPAETSQVHTLWKEHLLSQERLMLLCLLILEGPLIKTVPFRWFTVLKEWYSYPYLNQQKPLFLLIIAYTLSTTKLEIRAK
jgi:hypothetical protein